MSKRIALAFVAIVIISAGLLFVRPPQARAATYPISPVLLIHGWNANSSINCDTGSMWGTVEGYFNSHNFTNVHSLKFYDQDLNCGPSIGTDSRCDGWYDSGGNDGTVNEDIRHTTCRLAWYIWNTYTYWGTSVAVVAHSMGGILIRQAMNDTPYVTQFPLYLKITDVATAGTPHQGLRSGSAWYAQHYQGCPGDCVEVSQMERANALMSNMNSTSFRGGFARNPQGQGGTDWTTMSSENDEVLNQCAADLERMGAPTPVANAGACGLMPGATHFVVYPGTYPNYCHGCYLTDTNTAWNATEVYSDNNGGNWSSVSNSNHSVYTMHYAILYSSW